MKKNTRDNVARFAYDCGKLSFAMLVIGALAHRPFLMADACIGIGVTLLFFAAGVTIDQLRAAKEEI